MRELWRRILPMVFIVAALWLAKLASLAPVVLVEQIDFAKKQQKQGSYMGFRLMTDEDKRLSHMSLNDYISEVTKGRLFRVEGRDWEGLFSNLKAIKDGQKVAPKWSQRLPSDQYPMNALFFRADEPPVNAFSRFLVKPNQSVYVSRTDRGRAEYLELNYRVYSNDDFQYGSGLTSYPHPPAYLFFPFRKYSPWLVLAALVLYIALPRATLEPGAMRYPRWRIVLGDIIGILFAVTFFMAPLLILGGSIQAVTVGWPLLIFFWPFFFGGIWILVISAWYASYQIAVREDRLRIITYKGRRDFPYSEMESYQEVIFRPPRWLVVLTWMAAFAGKGSAGIGASGRAMILGSSASSSYCITMKDHSLLYINLTDQLGSMILKEAKKIVNELKKAGVTEQLPKEMRSLGFETLRLPQK
jgi:hypothetical protein